MNTMDGGQGGRGLGAVGGSTGSSGGSTPGPAIVLADGEDNPQTIAVDEANVFWTTSTSVRKVPKAGGSAATGVYDPTPAPYGVIVDETRLYWLEYTSTGDRNIVRAPKTGAGPVAIIATLPTFSGGGLAVDATDLFWIQEDGGMSVLATAPKSGGVTTVLLTQVGIGPPMLDGMDVYFAHTELNQLQVRRIPKRGGDVQTIFAGVPDSIGALAADATDFYLFAYNSDLPHYHLMKVPKAGGSPVTLTTGLELPKSVVLQDDALYYIVSFESGAPGYVAKVPKTGGVAVKLVSDALNPLALATDSQYVYWIEPGRDGEHEGRVRRVGR